MRIRKWMVAVVVVLLAVIRREGHQVGLEVEDKAGTLESTIELPHGPMAWTAERLKKP